MKILILLALLLLIGQCITQNNNLSVPSNLSNILYTNADLLTIGCINPDYRTNTATGKQYCADYPAGNASNPSNTSNATPGSCVLQYTDCCRSSYQDVMGNNQTLDTCVKVSKCDSFYEISTCVSDSTCTTNNCTLNSNPFNLVSNSNENDSGVPNTLSGFLALENNSYLKSIKKGWVQMKMCSANPLNKNAFQPNCCSNCSVQHYDLDGKLIFNNELPNFNDSQLSPILLASNVTSVFAQTAVKDKVMYFFNQCLDPRVQRLFGVAQTDEVHNWQWCQNLAYDWGQYFDNYQCNDWFCNKNGTCQAHNFAQMNAMNNNNNNTNATDYLLGSQVPMCTCNAGWKGKNCMFPQADYDYLSNYINGLDSWISNYADYIVDDETFTAYVKMLEYIIPFTSNAEAADQLAFARTVRKFWAFITTAVYNQFNPNVILQLTIFFDDLFYNSDSVQGLSSQFTNDLLTNYPQMDYDRRKFGFRSKANNVTGALSLGGDVLLNHHNNSNANNTNNNASAGNGGAVVVNNPDNATNNNSGNNSAGAGGDNATNNNNTTNGGTANNTNGNATNGSNITIITGSGGNKRFLVKLKSRVLQDNNGGAMIMPNNTNNASNNTNQTNSVYNVQRSLKTPSVVIPQNITGQFDNNTIFGLAYLRCPRAYTILNETSISSQIANVYAYGNLLIDISNNVVIVNNTNGTNNTVIIPIINDTNASNITNGNGTVALVTRGGNNNNSNLTNNSTAANNSQQDLDLDFIDNSVVYPPGDNMTVYIPWLYIPMLLSGTDTYSNNCTVVSFNGIRWASENNCTLDSSTDQNQAVLKCNKFGTFAVRCNSQPLDIANNGSNGSLLINSTCPLME